MSPPGPQQRNIRHAARKQREGIGVVAALAEKVFGRNVAGKGIVERQHAEGRGRDPGRPVNEGLYLRGARIGVARRVEIAEFLPDAADPADALVVGRMERDRLREIFQRRLELFKLTMQPAELSIKLRDMRTLGDQLIQQRSGDRILARFDQRLRQIGAACPMRGIDRKRVRIERDGVVGATLLHVDGGEVAPAGGEGRHQPQRRAVLLRGLFQIARGDPDIAKTGVKPCGVLGVRVRAGLDLGQSGPVGGRGLARIRPAARYSLARRS